MVATPKYQVSFDDLEMLSLAGSGNEPEKGTNGHLHTVNVPYAQKRDGLKVERPKVAEPP
jgi:hypothetical protein